MVARLSSMVLVTALVVSAQGWVDVTPATSPNFTWSVAMTYDEVNDYVIFVGFRDSVVGYETWTFSGGIWVQLPAASTAQITIPASPFPTHEMIFDQASGAPMLVITDSVYVQYGSVRTYLFVNGAWIRTQSPPPVIVSRQQYSSVSTALMSDRGLGRTLLYVYSSWPNVPSLYSFDGSDWTQQLTSWDPDFVSGTFYDEVRGRLVVLEGRSYLEWDGTAWSQAYPSFAIDPSRVAYCPSIGRAIGVTSVLTPLPGPYGTTVSVPMVHTIAYGDLVVRELHPDAQASYHSSYCITCDRRRNVVIDYCSGHTWEFAPGLPGGYSVSGTGCQGSRGTPALAPQPGAQVAAGYPFTLQAANLLLYGPAFLFFGASDQRYGGTALPFDLTPLGAPSCLLQCSGDVLIALPNVLGTATYTFTVPMVPGAVFFSQAIALDPSANALGLTLSNLGRCSIGY